MRCPAVPVRDFNEELLPQKVYVRNAFGPDHAVLIAAGLDDHPRRFVSRRECDPSVRASAARGHEGIGERNGRLWRQCKLSNAEAHELSPLSRRSACTSWGGGRRCRGRRRGPPRTRRRP